MSIAEKLTTIAENEQRVYEAGKTAEWSEMWDGLQVYGTRTHYNYFCAKGAFIVDTDTIPRWNFKPKYDIKPLNADWFLRETNAKDGAKWHKNLSIDLTEWLNGLGVKLDLSECTIINSFMYNSWIISRLPVLDLSKCTQMQYVFAYTDLQIIDGIISSETTNWNDAFFAANIPTLTHCIFSGVIAKPFNLSRTPNLDHESLISVLNCLKDYSGTSTAYTMTLGTTNLAKLTDTEKAIATEKGWTLS